MEDTDRSDNELPDRIRRLLWEYDPETLNWEEDRDLVIQRVLVRGGWDAVTWLRRRIGDDAIGRWIMAREGDDLSPRQLCFWQLILDLPEDTIDRWVEERRNSIWGQRLHP